jgi:hypothetical protein
LRETRKLAAILVTDVVGYSRLAGADEDRTLARLRGLRSGTSCITARTISRNPSALFEKSSLTAAIAGLASILVMAGLPLRESVT